MIIEQIWTGNSYRNFNYLIACPETGEALAVDPLDHKKCLALAKDRGWEITQILNTHEHGDHIGGNKAMVKATGARLIAHENAKDSIPGIDRGIAAGDVVKVGKTVDLLALDTPGHTMSHICLLSQTDVPGLFCGDTLFNAGAGNCHGGGHPEALYGTFVTQLDNLPDTTLVYPGHDYITTNLEFTLDREPDNAAAASLLGELTAKHDPEHATITSLGQEKEINTFFRLTSPTVIQRLQEKFPDLGESPSTRDVFVRLRELRNDW
jgi:hydroxyacylglutathione hydrolase